MKKKLNINIIIQNYILIMFIFITFETIILNFTSDISKSLLPFVRYGIEGAGYILLIFGIFTKRCIKFRLYIFDKLILCTIFISIISSLFNFVEPRIFVIGFRYLLRYLYIYILIRIAGWDEAAVRRFFKIFVSIMYIEILLVIWELLHRQSADLVLFPRYGNIIEGFSSALNTVSSKWAVYGSLGRYNLFGYFCVLAIWYWIAECETEKSKKSQFMIAIWLFLLVISFSRQTIVGIFGAYILFLLFKKKINWKQMLIIVISIVTVVILVINAASFVISGDYTSTGVGVVTGSVYDRYVSMFSLRFLQIDYEGYGRTWFISEGIRRLWCSKPFLGFGLGMYGCPDTLTMSSAVYDLLDIPTTYYMDVYLGCLLGQIGIFGTFTYLASYFSIMKHSKNMLNMSNNKNSIKLSVITFGVIVSSIIMMFFSSSLCNRVMAYYMWLMIGLFINSISKSRLNSSTA